MKSVALLALLVATPVFAADLTDVQKAQIDQTVTEALVKSGAPSASIAVIADDKIAYVKAYGDGRLKPQMPARPSMRYAIGSISKQFTAAAVLLLAEDGKLSLDESIARWYPKVTGADRITLRHLLSHTSGISDFWPQDYVMASMARDADPDRVIAEWGAKPLSFPPGDRYEYSNTGYTIAGRIVEKVSGQSLEAFLRQRVWTPLGMASVVNFDRGQLKPGEDAMGYDRIALAPPSPAPHEGSGWGLGAFQWAMTAEDLARWELSLIDRKLLRPTSYDQMFAVTRLNNGSRALYGLGLTVDSENHVQERPADAKGPRMAYPVTVLGHTGEVSGFVSAESVYPEARTGVVVLTNTLSMSPANDIARGVGDILNGRPLPLPPKPAPYPPPSAADLAIERVFAGLQAGQLDRRLLAPDLAAYFSGSAVADFASSLGPLGPPKRWVAFPPSVRGGMVHRAYRVYFDGPRSVNLNVYARADGKLEQFLVGED